MKKKQTSISYGIRLPEQVLQDMQTFAQDDKRSVNAEIVWILSEYSKQRKAKAKKD